MVEWSSPSSVAARLPAIAVDAKSFVFDERKSKSAVESLPEDYIPRPMDGSQAGWQKGWIDGRLEFVSLILLIVINFSETGFLWRFSL